MNHEYTGELLVETDASTLDKNTSSAMITLKMGDYSVQFDDTLHLREEVFNRVLQYFMHTEIFCAEGVHQSDECLIEAPNVLADIADMFNFKYLED